MHFVEKIVTDAVPYLNVKSQLILTLFGHVLNSLDYQLTFETWRTKFFYLKKRECDLFGHSFPDYPPCDNTVGSLLQKLKLPWKKVREGPSIDALHESKANETFLNQSPVILMCGPIGLQMNG